MPPSEPALGRLDEGTTDMSSHEAPTREVPALSQEQVAEPHEATGADEPPISVTDIVDDLLSPGDPGREGDAIQDATVIEDSVEAEEPLVPAPEPPIPAPEPPIPAPEPPIPAPEPPIPAPEPPIPAPEPPIPTPEPPSPAPEPPIPTPEPPSPAPEPPIPTPEPPVRRPQPRAPYEPPRVVKAVSDPDLALAVRSKLAEQPGLLPGTVDLEVVSGVVILRGEARHLETIEELGRRSEAVPGVREVRNLLRLPGEASPPASR